MLIFQLIIIFSSKSLLVKNNVHPSLYSMRCSLVMTVPDCPSDTHLSSLIRHKTCQPQHCLCLTWASFFLCPPPSFLLFRCFLHQCSSKDGPRVDSVSVLFPSTGAVTVTQAMSASAVTGHEYQPQL